MNIKAKAVAMVTVMGISFSVRGQQVISHTPVKDETIVKSTLFTLPSTDTNYYFRANLPGDNFLTIEFRKLSYWPGKGVLSDVVATARQSYQRMEDSFINAASSRKVALHIPANNAQVLANVAEYGKEDKLLVMQNGAALPLRIAMDTISIIKVLGQQSKDTSNKRQIKYTLILKDLSEINAIAENASLLDEIDRAFDSLVNSQRERWKNQDAWYHTLDAEYTWNSPQRLRTARMGTAGKGFTYSTELGASFIYNTISPIGIFKLGYSWPDKQGSFNYVALSYSGISFFKDANNLADVRSLSFINAEFGFANNNRSGGLTEYRTSFGVGYRVAAQKPPVYDIRYRFFFDYSISRALTLTPDFYVIPKTGDERAKTLAGITVSFKLFELL